MKRNLGILSLLILVMIVTAIISPSFFNPYNVKNMMSWVGLFGLLSLGAAFPIMTQGIDLSVGSMVALTGALSAIFLDVRGMGIGISLILVIGIAIILGLIHGLLITKVNIKPFVVTLCGLFIYRGLARFITNDATQGYGSGFLGLKFIARGRLPSAIWPGQPPQFITNWSLPMPFVILIVTGIIMAIFLNRSVYGRYILGVGSNEEATRLSGVDTDKVVILAYIISATFAAFGGILFSLNLNSVQPSTFGNMYELYAIAGAVVGGVSLRGGEGSIFGVVIGTAIVRVIYNAINIVGVATTLEYIVVGLVILIGVGADEVIKSIKAKRKLEESKIKFEEVQESG
ncbi:MAG: ABC transporter permease [Halanaerobiaceae bacterium]